MWIGDFVRCHSVVQVLRNRFPDRPIDMLSTMLCAPLADYMPGVRKAVIADLPRGRLGLTENLKLAARLKAEHYGSALIMSRKWKAALAPFLAGIPERTGFVGEARFVLLNDRRHGERALPRMVDQCAMLALPPAPPCRRHGLPRCSRSRRRRRRLEATTRLGRRRAPGRGAGAGCGRAVEALAG